MAPGIYKLNFKLTDKVYIGQALDIRRRYFAHLRDFTSGTNSKKLQQAYNTYGAPTLEIIAEVSAEELNRTEEEAIEIYNSIENGFNSMSYYSGNRCHISGEKASNANYSNTDYKNIFDLCVDGIYSDKEIAELSKVSISVVGTIRKCENHRWLKELYPDKYSILEERKKQFINGPHNCAEARGIVYNKLISPDGVIYEVKNVREFARTHNLHPSNLNDLLHGKFLTLHGWKLEGTKLKVYPKLISPQGEIIEISRLGASKFAEENGLNKGRLSMLLNGKIKIHKGWVRMEATN